MSLLKSFQKIPTEFKFLVAAYQETVTHLNVSLAKPASLKRMRSIIGKRSLFRCSDPDACITMPLQDDEFFVSDATVGMTCHKGNEIHSNNQTKMVGNQSMVLFT